MFAKTVLIFKSLLKFLPISRRNVYNYLWRHYGIFTCKTFGQFVKEKIRMYKLKSAIEFIRKCKNEELIPTFTRIRFANLSIADAKLKQSVSYIVYIRLQSISEEIVRRKMGKVETTHEEKLAALRGKKIARGPRQGNNQLITNRPYQIVDPVANVSKELKSPVINLSEYKLSKTEENALINGLHHVYSPEKLDQSQLVCNMEYFYARLLNVRTAYRHYEQKAATEVVRHQLTSLQLSSASELRETANIFRKTAEFELKRIGVEHRKTFNILRRLSQNASIIITRPDKGRGVVIMNRADYVQKMNTILNDSSAFTLIHHDPTLDTESDLNTFLLELKKEGFITEQEYKLSYSTGSRPARIYGLPKLHKARENYPLRPVMSATKTVTYGLGKMLANRLNTIRTSPYIIKDSFDFIQKIKQLELGNRTMVSFDVTSLFTRVPLTYTIDLILNKMYPKCSAKCKYKQRSRLCTECRKRYNFEYLLRLATSKTHFIFDKKMYIQHNGVAMGASLAPIIADIFMSHLKETLMDRLRQNGVCQWYRYVDDTFVIIEPTTKIENLLEILNNFHQSIKFTYQLEMNATLPFLDTWVIRSANTKKFQTALYRKDTFTGLITKWNSFVPINYKKASVVTMIQRALTICSTYSLLAIELDNIRAIGLHNGYPISFIDQTIRIGLSKHLNRSVTTDVIIFTCDKQKMYVEIPYTGAATHSFQRKLANIAAKLRPDLDVRFFARPPPSIQMFFPNKDPIPKYLKSDIVYSIKCTDCDAIYVGETERQAIRRLWEHGAPKTLFQDQLISVYPTNQEHSNKAQPTLTQYLPAKKTQGRRAVPYPNPQLLQRVIPRRKTGQGYQTHRPSPSRTKTQTHHQRTISTSGRNWSPHRLDKFQSSLERHIFL